MAYCTQCGESNRPGARFCRVCGAPMELDDETYEDEAVTLPSRTVVDQPPAIVDPWGPTRAAGSANDPAAEPVPDAQDDRQPAPPEDPLAEQPPIIPESEPAAAPSAELAALQVGDLLGLRYHIGNLEETRENGDRVFAAEDILTCWSCHAALPQPGLSYCESCGAALTQFPAVRVVEIAGGGAEQSEDGQVQMENGRRFRVEPAIPPATPETGSGFRLAVGQRTSPGRLRETNEDSLLVVQITATCENLPDPQIHFFAVADGVGGSDAGEVASRLAVHALAEELYRQVLQPLFGDEALTTETLGERLREMVNLANLKILETRQEKAVDMGSTVTALLLNGADGVVANVGDSRTYLFRDGKLAQITTDHSVVANLVANGLIQPDDVYSHDQRNIILRSLGDHAELEIDLFPVHAQPGDRFLLCCDGLWEMVRNPMIEDVLLEQPDPQAACSRLVQFANLAGGDDNISVILVDVHPVEKRSEF